MLRTHCFWAKVSPISKCGQNRKHCFAPSNANLLQIDTKKFWGNIFSSWEANYFYHKNISQLSELAKKWDSMIEDMFQEREQTANSVCINVLSICLTNFACGIRQLSRNFVDVILGQVYPFCEFRTMASEPEIISFHCQI